LPTVSLVHIVTQWSGSGGTEAYLSGQLASFSALMLLGWVIWPVKIVPEMTYKVSSGTLNLCSINQSINPSFYGELGLIQYDVPWTAKSLHSKEQDLNPFAFIAQSTRIKPCDRLTAIIDISCIQYSLRKNIKVSLMSLLTARCKLLCQGYKVSVSGCSPERN